jgi:hypothetical protein
MVIHQSGLLEAVPISHLLFIILTEDASTEKEADDSLTLFAIEPWHLE